MCSACSKIHDVASVFLLIIKSVESLCYVFVFLESKERSEIGQNTSEHSEKHKRKRYIFENCICFFHISSLEVSVNECCVLNVCAVVTVDYYKHYHCIKNQPFYDNRLFIKCLSDTNSLFFKDVVCK